MTLDNLQKSVGALVLVAVLLAAMAISLDSFQDNIESDDACDAANATYNVSSQRCEDSNGVATGGTNAQFNVTQEGLRGTANATGFLDTVGTLIGVAALIAVVVGAFIFARR